MHALLLRARSSFVFQKTSGRERGGVSKDCMSLLIALHRPSFYVQGAVQPFKAALAERGVLVCLDVESRMRVLEEVVARVAAR